ncbi:MAG TPA: RidA family protein [Alphaproteobacteria bacterium]|jgi:enamine deaminase RidA (YjgF/YER057c/UK114 family)
MRMTYLSILSMLFAGAFAAQASAQELKKDYIGPMNDQASTNIVKVKGGTLVFLAGHTASVADRNAGLGNFDAQAKNTMDKIKATMEKSGGSLDDIVQMSVYLQDLRYEPQFVKYAKTIFKEGSYPAMTFVEVTHLARPESLMEIQPVAVLK